MMVSTGLELHDSLPCATRFLSQLLLHKTTKLTDVTSGAENDLLVNAYIAYTV
jgi:hypothetical protein